MLAKFLLILFAAVAGRVFVAVSAPGQSWQATTAPEHVWSRMASSTDGAKFVVTIYSGQIITSAESGAIWPPPASNWNLKQSTNLADAIWDTPVESIGDDARINSSLSNRQWALVSSDFPNPET